MPTPTTAQGRRIVAALMRRRMAMPTHPSRAELHREAVRRDTLPPEPRSR